MMTITPGVKSQIEDESNITGNLEAGKYVECCSKRTKKMI
jgi:hypothetical protein